MDVLILGGTSFLGRHLVEAARAGGDRVTTFTRGKTNPDLFAGEVEQLRGDRDGDLGTLEGKRFDAVIDTSGYVPRVVRAGAEILKGSGHYTFISTISVYPEETMLDADEDSDVLELTEETEAVTAESYGPLKVACERAVQEIFGDRALISRPGLIVGPYDPTDRFTYWPERVAAGGKVLAPGDPSQLVQLIDARDLAEWIVRAAHAGTAGVFNAVTEPFPMGELLAVCDAVARAGATFEWVPAEFLLEHDVGPWMELPLWLPEGDMLTSNGRAMKAGMTFRPLEITVSETLAWAKTRPDGPRRAGLDQTKEAAVLAAWAARNT